MMDIWDTFWGGLDAEGRDAEGLLERFREFHVSISAIELRLLDFTKQEAEVWGRGIAFPIRLRGLGECQTSPVGSGAEPWAKMDLVHFELNKTHLW